MKKVLILFFSIFLLSGCYDYHELNDLEIVSSMIIDYKDEEYEINIEVLDTSDSAKTGSYFLSGTGQSIEEAINNIYFDSASTPFYSHMKTLIISKNVAEEGISEYFDFLLRDTHFRKDFFVFITDEVDKILEYETEPKESIGEMARMNAKKNHEENGRYRTSTFRELVYSYLRNNNYMIGSLEIEDDKIFLDDTYLFVDNKLGLKVDENAVLLANMLLEGNKEFEIFGDYSYQIHAYKLSSEIKKDKIILKFEGQARLLNAQDVSSLDDKELRKLEKNLNESIEKSGKEIIEYTKRLDCDMFNFNYSYYLHYPKLVEEETWQNIEYVFQSDLKISEKGLLLNSLGGSKDGE